MPPSGSTLERNENLPVPSLVCAPLTIVPFTSNNSKIEASASNPLPCTPAKSSVTSSSTSIRSVVRGFAIWGRESAMIVGGWLSKVKIKSSVSVLPMRSVYWTLIVYSPSAEPSRERPPSIVQIRRSFSSSVVRGFAATTIPFLLTVTVDFDSEKSSPGPM